MSWADGTFGFNTLIHEIGHSLGLKHPHNAFYPNSSETGSPLMPLAYDAQYYTVMAYRDYVGDNLMPSPDGSSDGLIICSTCGQFMAMDPSRLLAHHQKNQLLMIENK